MGYNNGKYPKRGSVFHNDSSLCAGGPADSGCTATEIDYFRRVFEQLINPASILTEQDNRE
eukprot:gene7195-8863_t